MKEAEPIRRWQVGAVSVTKVSEGVLESGLDAPSPDEGFLGDATCDALLAIDWLRPDFVTEKGHVRLAFHALVVQTSSHRIVVDTCVGNDKIRPQQHFWDRLAGPFLSSFSAAGFRREEIDTVVCTHLHVDHVGWNTMKIDGRWVPTFPNARYLLGRTEYESCSASARDAADSLHPAVFLEDSIQPIFDAGLVDLVDASHRICDEVRLIPTHGHTPGHVSVLIESQGKRAIITGDTIHHPCQLEHPAWAVRADADKTAAIATRKNLLDANAGTGTLFIGTHWAGRSSGRVTRAGESFRLE
jgi:glyoxylase-like metal-dependent hydrolase (beta-lactamase superfamily II)